MLKYKYSKFIESGDFYMTKPRFLYHISNRISDDESILKPHKNVDTTGQNEDYYVFASQWPDYISCFRDKFSFFRAGYTDIDDTRVMIIVTRDIENLRNSMRSNPSRIYTVSSDTFTQVIDKSGKPTSEWISKTEVPIIEKGKIQYQEILENAQVFYMETQAEFGTKQYNEFVRDLGQRYSNIKEVLNDLTKNGILVYENGVTKINDEWIEDKQVEVIEER